VLRFLQNEPCTKLLDLTWPKTQNLGRIKLMRTSLWMVLRDVPLRFVPMFTLCKTFRIGYYVMFVVCFPAVTTHCGFIFTAR